MVHTELTAQTPDGPMKCFTSRPDGEGPFPVVVMLMDAGGVSEELRGMADRYAEQARVLVVLPDLYHRIEEGLVFDRKAAFSPGGEELKGRLLKASNSLTNENLIDDTGAALDAAASDPAASDGPAGMVGYCVGGHGVIVAMAALGDRIAAGSAIHPSHVVVDGPESPHLRMPEIKGEIYLGCGGEDHWASPEVIATLREALEQGGVEYTIDVTPGADHGFALKSFAVRYHPEADRLHWERTLDLFKRRLSGAPVA